MDLTNVDFFSSHFNAQRFIEELCTEDVSLETIRQHRERIQAQAERNKQELKATVYRNHGRYIHTSQEISQLNTEVHQLNSMLEKQHIMIHDVHDLVDGGQVPGAASTSRKQNNALSDVEGLDDTNPLLKGELIHEGMLRMSDDPDDDYGTDVHLFLLSSCLVVAQPSKHGDLSQLQLHSLEDLADIVVRDDYDDEDNQLTFVVENVHDANMRHTMYLLPESIAEKRLWTRLIKRTQQAQRIRNALTRSAGTAEELGDEHDILEELHRVPEDLDVLISQREFDQAVKQIEAVRSQLADLKSAREAQRILDQIDKRADDLTQALCQELNRPGLLARAVRQSIFLLIQLGLEEKARVMYLQTCSRNIAREASKLKMEGSMELYMQKLSSAFCEAVANSADYYRQMFDDTSRTTYVSWLDMEVQSFADIFIRQVVESTSVGFVSVAECFEVIMQQAKKVSGVGIDLEFILLRHLRKSCRAALEEAGRQVLQNIALSFVDPDWNPVPFSTKQARTEFLQNLESIGVRHSEDYLEGMATSLWESTQQFALQTHEFAVSANRMWLQDTASTILKWIKSHFALFIGKLAQEHAGEEIFVYNANFVLNHCFPHVRAMFEDTHGPIPQLNDIGSEISATWNKALEDDEVALV